MTHRLFEDLSFFTTGIARPGRRHGTFKRTGEPCWQTGDLAWDGRVTVRVGLDHSMRNRRPRTIRVREEDVHWQPTIAEHLRKIRESGIIDGSVIGQVAGVSSFNPDYTGVEIPFSEDFSFGGIPGLGPPSAHSPPTYTRATVTADPVGEPFTPESAVRFSDAMIADQLRKLFDRRAPAPQPYRELFWMKSHSTHQWLRISVVGPELDFAIFEPHGRPVAIRFPIADIAQIIEALKKA